MSLISGEFALFAAVLVAAFYLVPKRAQYKKSFISLSSIFSGIQQKYPTINFYSRR